MWLHWSRSFLLRFSLHPNRYLLYRYIHTPAFSPFRYLRRSLVQTRGQEKGYNFGINDGVSCFLLNFFFVHFELTLNPKKSFSAADISVLRRTCGPRGQPSVPSSYHHCSALLLWVAAGLGHDPGLYNGFNGFETPLPLASGAPSKIACGAETNAWALGSLTQ